MIKEEVQSDTGGLSGNCRGKDETGLKECLYSESQIIFLLFGDICSVGRYVEIAKSAGKMVFVHMDLINGLGNKEVAVDFIREHTGVDGIISTKPQLVKRAKELGCSESLGSS